jgi:hypothetical protein
MFVVKHEDLFTLNMELHNINTCHKLDFHVPLVSLTKVQQGGYYSDIIISFFIREYHMPLNSSYSPEEYLDRDNKFELGVSSNYSLYLSWPLICVYIYIYIYCN